MKIARYIYTRLPKNLSPTGKNGFQSAFLPGDLLSNKEVLEIESHIHFPEGVQIPAKSVVFYKAIKGEMYRILLLLRPLSDVKDEHGRGGVFLCEGFLVREADWRPADRMQEFKDMVQPHRFASLDQLLESPAVDRLAGKIQDLEVDFQPAMAQQEEAEKPAPELLMAVYHVAHTQDRDLAVVLQGPPATVSRCFETCAAYLPDALRPQLAWDDAYDAGKIFFSPLRIFGFSTSLPVTGKPALFSDNGQTAIWPDPASQRYGAPTDPFSAWLLEASEDQAPPRRLLNDLYALSQAMVSKSPGSPDMPSDRLFEQVNQTAIRQLFESGLQGALGERWPGILGAAVPVHDQLLCWMRGYPAVEIGMALQKGILAQGIGPETIPDAPSAKVVAQGSPLLQLLASMWTRQVPGEEVLNQLGPAETRDGLSHLLRRGVHTDSPLLKVLVYFRAHLSGLTADPKVAENLGYYVEAKVPAQYSELKQPLARMVVEAGDWGCLAGEPVDWLRHLDRWLQMTGGDVAAWKALKRLGKSQEIQAWPHVRAFATGDSLPAGLVPNSEGRKGLLKALLQAHGLKESQIVDLGFSEKEVTEMGGTGGFLGKIKRLFGG